MGKDIEKNIKELQKEKKKLINAKKRSVGKVVVKERIRDKVVVEESRKILKTLRPIDNYAFSFFASSKDFCQEFLREVLQDKNLVVIDNAPQKHIPNSYFKSVYLDLLCKLSDGRIVNVEVQLYEEDDVPRRIFYYASLMRTAFVKKGTKYKDIDDIIVIYLTEKDILGKGSTVYDVKMQIWSDKNKYVEDFKCGLNIYYVNTEGMTNKPIKEYLKTLTDRTTFNKKFPETMKMKKEFVEMKGASMDFYFPDLEERISEKAKKKWRQEGREEGMQQTIINLVKDGLLSVKEAAKRLGMTEKKFSNLVACM